MRLILIRHARTLANVMGALDTQFPGNPLDEAGLDQAQNLPRRLEAAGLLDEVSALAVSPILRARQTIAPLERATGLSARVDSGLREVLAGDLEMDTAVESVACYTDTTRAWMTGRLHCRLPGSRENGVDTVNRFDAAVEALWRATVTASGSGGTAALVSHGTVLRLWTALRALGEGDAGEPRPQWIADHPVRNTGICVVEGEPGAWRLMSWNDGEWIRSQG